MPTAVPNDPLQPDAATRDFARNSGAKIPRDNARSLKTYSSMTDLNWPRNHLPIGTGKPIFDRDRIFSGKTPFMLSRRTYFVVPPRKLHRVGHARSELHQFVIEKRHATLDRRRHAHLVLLHQQFVQVGLDVCIEQTDRAEIGLSVRSQQVFAVQRKDRSRRIRSFVSRREHLLLHWRWENGEVVEVNTFEFRREHQESAHQLLPHASSRWHSFDLFSNRISGN